MKNKSLVIMIALVIVVLALSAFGISSTPVTADLVQGENTLYVDQYFPSLSVERLMQFHPEIESVSMQAYGQTYAYLNVFGGVGTPFLVQPGVTYEVYVSKPISIDFLDTAMLYGLS